MKSEQLRTSSSTHQQQLAIIKLGTRAWENLFSTPDFAMSLLGYFWVSSSSYQRRLRAPSPDAEAPIDKRKWFIMLKQ